VEKILQYELHNLYFSPNVIKEIKPRWIRRAGHAARIGGYSTQIKKIEKAEQTRSHGRTRFTWEYNKN
jgi:hypothetical protein